MLIVCVILGEPIYSPQIFYLFLLMF